MCPRVRTPMLLLASLALLSPSHHNGHARTQSLGRTRNDVQLGAYITRLRRASKRSRKALWLFIAVRSARERALVAWIAHWERTEAFGLYAIMRTNFCYLHSFHTNTARLRSLCMTLQCAMRMVSSTRLVPPTGFQLDRAFKCRQSVRTRARP